METLFWLLLVYVVANFLLDVFKTKIALGFFTFYENREKDPKKIYYVKRVKQHIIEKNYGEAKKELEILRSI